MCYFFVHWGQSEEFYVQLLLADKDAKLTLTGAAQNVLGRRPK